MKYLKAVLFIFGFMLWGSTLGRKFDGDEVLFLFACYGFIGLSVVIAWSEVRKLLLELKG
ncbi:hypothetical protein [Cedecea neteri]|uniref:hypothetical protein n=1 Tax=Cedecea neteri TaxID=158822 RepID=UPI002898E1DC|nr:hypothetical protein [Cedecea neteri]